jgi:hypothetical protein
MAGRRVNPYGREPRLNVPVLVPDGVQVGLAPIEGRIIIAMVSDDEVLTFSLYPATAANVAADLVRAVDDLARMMATDDA